MNPMRSTLLITVAATFAVACTADPLQGPIDGPRSHANPDGWVLGPDCVNCTRAPIGPALWAPARVVLVSGNVGVSGAQATSLLQSLLQPRHAPGASAGMFVSAERHPPPYDDETYEMLDARGIAATQAFSDVQFTAPQGVTMLMTLEPATPAPTAPSVDFDVGPVIDRQAFPISVDVQLYRNGAVFGQAFNRSLAVSEGSPALSHLFVGLAGNSALGTLAGAPDGKYQYQLTMTDARGSGWNVTVPFTVGDVGTPSTPGADVTLTPDATGFIDGTNAAGVRGSWWAAGDLYGVDGSIGGGACPMGGFPPPQCSMITAPTPGQPWVPSADGRMCTSGVVAQVFPDSSGAPAWSAIWGTLVGFNLAEMADPSGGRAIAGPYDAVARGITGFAFDIDFPPAGGHLRVNVATPATNNNAAYWRGASADVSPVSVPSHYEVRWSEVGGPMYLGASAPRFDPTQISAISWQVVANQFSSVPYSFCIANVTLLTN
jgi:hypothetical protein